MLIIAIIFSCLFVFCFMSLFFRCQDETYDNEILVKIKNSRNKVLKVGLIGLVVSWINYYLYSLDEPMNMWLNFIKGFTPLTTIILLISLFLIWVITPSHQTLQDEKKLETNKKTLQQFLQNYNINKKLTVSDYVVGICNIQKVLIIYKNISPKNFQLYYEAIPFSSMIECEIIEDNSTIMKSGLGRAVVGAAIAGTTGAIIGVATRKTTDVVNNLSIRIITNEVLNPHHEIKIVTETMNRNSDEYKQIYNDIQKIYSSVVAIINLNK